MNVRSGDRQRTPPLFCILYAPIWLFPAEHIRILCQMHLHHNITYIKSNYEKGGQSSGDQEKGDGAVWLRVCPL